VGFNDLLMAVPLPFLPLVAMTDPALLPVDLPAPAMVSPLDVEPIEPLDADRFEVRDFDPIKRARQLALELPRQWQGTLRLAKSTEQLPADLVIDRLVPLEAMVDVFGQLTIAGQSVPVQGNLNAATDQLSLVPLGDDLPAELEPGGNFLGLQMFNISMWIGPRLTSRAALLSLQPITSYQEPPVRGLW